MRAKFMVVAALLVLVSGCNPAPSTTVPKSTDASVKDIDACLSHVERINDVVNVDCHLTSAWDDAQFIDLEAITSRRVAQAFQNKSAWTQGATFVNLNFTADLKYQARDIAPTNFMLLTFTSEDLQQAKLDGLTNTDLLNLVHAVSVHPIAFAALDSWCLKHGDDGGAFCAQAKR